MTEVLTQEEVNQLLNAIDKGDAESKKSEVSDGSRKIRIYDFRRPDRFSKKHLLKINELSEIFAKLITETLSAKCKCVCNVRTAWVGQLTYNEFIRSIPTPSCIGIINPEPLKPGWIMEIDSGTTISILNACLGGIPENRKKNIFTDIECHLMKNIIDKMLVNFQEAWGDVLYLHPELVKPKLDRIESIPQDVKIITPNEIVALITLETVIADVSGMINLCIPYISIKPIMDNLLNYLNFYKTGSKKSANHAFLTDTLDTSNIVKTIRIEYPRLYLTVEELQKLNTGDTLKFFCYTEKFKSIKSESEEKIENPCICSLFIDNVHIGAFEYNKTFEYNNHKAIIIKKFLKSDSIIKEDLFMNKPNLTEITGSYKDIKVQIITELGRIDKTLGDVQAFEEGTILEFDKSTSDPVDIYANNVKIAKGEVVAINESFGVRITELLK
jgi:flagellar motor switch protein FliM